MDQRPLPFTPANCSPVFSIAGVMHTSSETWWKTAYPNPDAGSGAPRAKGHGPTFTIAGVIAGTPQTAWRTACPDPTRDTLDAYGHVITKVEAAARAELAASRADVLALRRGRHSLADHTNQAA